MKDSQKPAPELKVSEAFAELEKIVAAFESEALDLEESMPKFKRGLELAKLVKSKLAVMENEIKEIQAEFQDDDRLTTTQESTGNNEGDETELPF